MTVSEQLVEIPLKELRTDAELNVRTVNSHDESVRELAASIKTQGVLEPVVVTKEKGTKGYRLVFGFRRAAAARLAGLITVPAVVREFTDTEILEAQLVENLQREDLSPLEEARALQKVLGGEGAPSQGELAKRIGKSQPWLSNRIRLLGLPEPALKAIESEDLSATHGEIFLSLPKEATPNEVRALLDQQKRSELNTHQFKAEVQQASARINRRTRAKQQRRGAISRAKFPDCTVKGCGKHGAPEVTYEGYSKDFRCSNGHRWNSLTGKVVKSESPRTPESSRPRAPPVPKLPLVSRDIAEHPGVEAIGKKLLSDLGPISGVSVSAGNQRGTVHIELDVESIDVGVKEPRIAAFSVGMREYPPTKALRIMQDWEWSNLQATDKGRKVAADLREGMLDWLGGIRGVGRPKKAADEPTEKAPTASAQVKPARSPGTKQSKKPKAPRTLDAATEEGASASSPPADGAAPTPSEALPVPSE
ncbi:MAG: ParB/RepB/Spo0J family partition protein [Thermoplasmata archaeon]|nr:ParB/RepB/Spo0J family partition protein [Thermoplasmata archaeon]